MAAIAGELHTDHVELLKWINRDIARSTQVFSDTEAVRALAQELVEDVSRQGAARHAREEDLVRESQRVHELLDEDPEPPPKFRYLDLGTAPTRLNDWAFGRTTRSRAGYSGPDADWEDWVTTSEQHWDEIKAAAGALIDAGNKPAPRREPRAAAERAVESMDQTVRRALRWSETCFPDGPRRLAQPLPKVSWLPLACFLAAALFGIPLRPNPVAGWIFAAVLLVATALSVAVGIKHRFKGVAAATLGAGSSFAFFTASYLAVRLLEPDSLLQSGAPISSIADAAFTTLTVGPFGSTIGIDIEHAARVIAFIQILLTTAAVASGITWAWRRLLAHTEPRPVPNPEVDGPQR